MKKIGLSLIFLLFLLSAQYLAATDYYVDSNSGSDSNTGRSPQAAWRTIGRVNDAMDDFEPGDNIYFKGGSVFGDENLFIDCEGSPGNPITFGSYGTGRPKFNSRNIRCGRGNGYITVDNFEIYNTSGDGIEFYKNSGWHYDIKITNCYVRNAGNVGIFIQSADGYLIENCTVHDSYNGNIYAYGSDYPIRNGIIRGCVSYDAIQNDGICIHEGDNREPCGPNHLIVNCLAHGNAEEGFDMSDGSNITIRNCRAYGDDYAGFILEAQNNVVMDRCIARNGHHGIHIGGDNVTIQNCLVYDNDDNQILIEPYTVISGINIYHNILVHPASGNSDAIIQAWNNYSDVNIKNNIIMTKQSTYPNRLISFERSPSSANIDLDYNCYYHPGGSSGRFAAGSSYSFSSWQSAYNHESHSMFTNPYLTNPSQNDYTLTGSSPCIDAGTNVGINKDFQGSTRPQGSGYDIGAYEFNGGPTPLQASALASPRSGQAPLTINFTGEAWGGSSPYSYRWTFGDGSSSTQQNPSHTYSQAGSYTATFTVTDDDDNQESDSVTISVSAANPLSAGIVASPTSGEAPLTVSFTGTATGGSSPYSFFWRFDDGDTSSQQNPTHTFSEPGTYSVTLTVTDDNDDQDSASISITVSQPTPDLTASAGASPMTGIAPLDVRFTGSVSGGSSPYSYRWTFGDGSSSTQQNPSHTYSQAGSYTATFTVTDSESRQSSASVTIKVSAVIGDEVRLRLSVQTGQPSEGKGGWIVPSIGVHTYTLGTVVKLRAKPNKGFRFSRWIGDIREDAVGKRNTSIVMYADKTITALFCSICGDVNGDGRLSPLDSQAVFDVFLGRNTNPSVCQRENGDVNGDGSRKEPHLSPADAQAIFTKYLGKKELPCDCSYNIRTAFLSPFGLEPLSAADTASLERPTQDIHLGLDELRKVSETEVHLPVMINNPHDVDAFGFDLAFPADMLKFTGVAKTEMVKDFYQVEGHVTEEGVVRVGGYSADAIASQEGGELVILIFKLKRKGIGNRKSIYIKQTFDDVESAYYVQREKSHGSKKANNYVRR
jgi:PKD repeat protein